MGDRKDTARNVGFKMTGAAPNAWLLLALAIVFEVAFTFSLKASEGFTRLGPSIAAAILVTASISLLILALRSLPLSIAYPMWVGAGALGTVVIGRLLYNEPLTALKLVSIAAIAAGVAGLKIASSQ